LLGLLQSAIAMPASGFGDQYLQEDVFEMAGAYLFHITQNHPFVDGNKRTGAVAAVVFLAMNDIKLSADEDELESLVRSVATGNSDKPAAAMFFRNKSRK
jgi:death on curing protein